MKRKSRIVLVLTGPILVGIAFVLFFAFSDAVAVDEFAQVSNGMTEAQVRELLGAPHHVRRYSPERMAFFYGGFQRLKWCSMEVFFGARGQVTGKFHDH